MKLKSMIIMILLILAVSGIVNSIIWKKETIELIPDYCVLSENITISEYNYSVELIYNLENESYENKTIVTENNITKEICLEKTDIINVSGSLTILSHINMGYDGEYIFDDMLDGNGDGVYKPGESGCNISDDKIVCFGHNKKRLKDILKDKKIK